MKTLKFKTNIKCSGCIARVTPELNKLSNLHNWSVDTLSPDKLLSVVTDDSDPQSIIDAVRRAGYDASLIGQN